MICKECGEDKIYYSLGMCKKCYCKQYNAKYRGTHTEEIKIAKKKYRTNNRDKVRESNQRYHYARGGKPASENKQCTVFLGVHVAERVLSNVFKDVKQMPYGHKGFDFICNKGKKIDAKSSCAHTSKYGKLSWVFHIKRNQIADFFLCLSFDNREDLNPQHAWLIPGIIINHLGSASISESTHLKWDEYKLDINKVVACCNTMKQRGEQ